MRRLPLHDREGRVRAYALVDDEDFERVSRWRWSLHSRGYAIRTPRGRSILLHRFLMGLEPGDRRQVDHLNLNKLDCRRENMRVISHVGNAQNCRSRPGSTSRFRGVSVRRSTGRWVAQLKVGSRARHVGTFVDEVAAAVAVNAERSRLMPGALPDPELVRLGLA